MYSRVIIDMFIISQVSGLVENFNIRINFESDTISVIDVKFCMVVLLFELYLFIPLSLTLTIFQGHTAMANSFNLKFCVLIQLFVVMLSKLSI